MPYNMPLMPSPRFSSYLSPPYRRILDPLKREHAAGAENPIYTRLSEIKRGRLLEGVHKAETSYDFSVSRSANGLWGVAWGCEGCRGELFGLLAVYGATVCPVVDYCSCWLSLIKPPRNALPYQTIYFLDFMLFWGIDDPCKAHPELLDSKLMCVQTF
jgi:hypothetical protein